MRFCRCQRTRNLKTFTKFFKFVAEGMMTVKCSIMINGKKNDAIFVSKCDKSMKFSSCYSFLFSRGGKTEVPKFSNCGKNSLPRKVSFLQFFFKVKMFFRRMYFWVRSEWGPTWAVLMFMVYLSEPTNQLYEIPRICYQTQGQHIQWTFHSLQWLWSD